MTQAFAALHVSPAGQSLVVLHASQSPLFGPLVAQTADRHTVDPVAPVHGPSPFAHPHLLSFESHTPDTHARVPIVSFVPHEPPGTAVPFGVSGWQTPGPLRLSHQLPVPHCASLVQLVWHAPVFMLHSGPGWVPIVQLALLVHSPHAPVLVQ